MSFKYDKPIETLELSDQPKLDSAITEKRFLNCVCIINFFTDVLIFCKYFDWKVAIVSGGAGGIGSAVVARFLNDGASVAIFDLNVERANKLLQVDFKEAAEHGRLRCYNVNVAQRQACFDNVQQVVNDFGKVNFLFNGVANFNCSVSNALDSL